MGYYLVRYPLIICHIAIENGHKNSGFSHKKWWLFHSFVNVYQRVLVGGNPSIYFSHCWKNAPANIWILLLILFFHSVGNVIIPTDESYFSERVKPPTRLAYIYTFNTTYDANAYDSLMDFPNFGCLVDPSLGSFWIFSWDITDIWIIATWIWTFDVHGFSFFFGWAAIHPYIPANFLIWTGTEGYH